MMYLGSNNNWRSKITSDFRLIIRVLFGKKEVKLKFEKKYLKFVVCYIVNITALENGVFGCKITDSYYKN